MEVKRVEIHWDDKDPEKVSNKYLADGVQHYKVWFKFGCAHIHILKDDPAEEEDYLHICEPKEFIKFLQDAMELSEKEGNSWEQD